MVGQAPWERVFSEYAYAIERFRTDTFDENLLERVTFSDSFLIYTDDDSALSYRAIDSFCRLFVLRLVLGSLPVRGAIACAEFYADPEASLYFGPGLLESHDVGESTNWLGLVLSESARDRLREMELRVEERLNYAIWPVPLKKRDDSTPETCEMAAFILGASPSTDNLQPVLEKLKTMRDRLDCSEVQAKYENTIHFLESSARDVRRITSDCRLTNPKS